VGPIQQRKSLDGPLEMKMMMMMMMMMMMLMMMMRIYHR
jgi:hypothetical protein